MKDVSNIDGPISWDPANLGPCTERVASVGVCSNIDSLISRESAEDLRRREYGLYDKSFRLLMYESSGEYLGINREKTGEQR
jgi:hypothetical protein